MSARKLTITFPIAVLIAALIAAASIIAPIMIAPMIAAPAAERPAEIAGSYVLDVRDALKNDVKITVKRADGSIEVYEKAGDPWTVNVMYFIANYLLGREKVSAVSMIREDGTSRRIETEYVYTGGNTYTNIDPKVVIGIGSGSTPPSVYDVDLYNPIVKIEVPSTSVSVSDSGTALTATYTASWTATGSYAIRETGLYMLAAELGTNSIDDRFLLSRDVLDEPITVESGDVVSVTYTVTMEYARPPLTKHMAAIIFNYMLGLNAYGLARTLITTDGTSTTNVDLGYESNTSPYDVIKESAKLVVGSGAPSYLPTKLAVSNPVATVSDIRVNYQVVNSTHMRIYWVGGVGLTGEVTVTEVGVYMNTDIEASNTGNQKDIMVLYFPLSTPVAVPAGGALKFSFDLYIRA
ncbi:MAG: hypothetical protein QW692_01820 [Nitrososphaerota archaeon]